jgi:CTP:molybdopterin cytidylyltransferase MocA
MKNTDPQILILAAGASSRMGARDKLLEMVGDQTLIAQIAKAALTTGAPVTITLPTDRPLRADALTRLGLSRVLVPDAALGMAASLKAGLATIDAAAPVLLLLADLPEITADDLGQMLGAWRQTPDMILRATGADGMPGHPVCFPPWARKALMSLQGDQGARDFLQAQHARTRYFALPDAHATTDLDTPEDWARWRKR